MPPGHPTSYTLRGRSGGGLADSGSLARKCFPQKSNPRRAEGQVDLAYPAAIHLSNEPTALPPTQPSSGRPSTRTSASLPLAVPRHVVSTYPVPVIRCRLRTLAGALVARLSSAGPLGGNCSGKSGRRYGLPSADRGNKATLPLTGPFRTAKSSAKDLTPLVSKLQYANYHDTILEPWRNRLLRR